MESDSPYEALTQESGTEESADQRWAFGTGFADPLAGVSADLPEGVDRAALAAYCLMLGDDALVMSHRLQEWLARAPELEEETALANLALDLLGQARLLLTRAGQADGTGRDEDDFAFGRDPAEFRNVTLAEVTDADFGGLIARLLVFSTWRLALLGRLRDSRDPVLAAVAALGVREVAYHRDYAARWLLRLAGGTDVSRARITAGLAAVAPLMPALFTPSDEERSLIAQRIAPNPASLRPEADAVLAEVLNQAGLPWPPASAASPPPGRAGAHTPALTDLVTELQSVARTLPGATW
jgi:ring-1,2-phenylacetyl-CoA epoxidase subunit PaaC